VVEKIQGITNPCIFKSFSSFLNGYKLEMDHFWCHWKEDEISYKLWENKIKIENEKKLHLEIAVENLL
jgi:hypothetical protein